jgi:hypothetical protein
MSPESWLRLAVAGASTSPCTMGSPRSDCLALSRLRSHPHSRLRTTVTASSTDLARVFGKRWDELGLVVPVVVCFLPSAEAVGQVVQRESSGSTFVDL